MSTQAYAYLGLNYLCIFDMQRKMTLTVLLKWFELLFAAELISRHMCERQELDARLSWAMWTELEMTRHASCQAVDLHLCNIFVAFVSGSGCQSADVAFARIHLIHMYSVSYIG